VVHAWRGTRQLDQAEERVEDDALVDTLRRQAARVWILSAAAAAALTLVTFLVPG
jgi:hypothetical protein